MWTPIDTSTEEKNEVKMRRSLRTIHSLCDNEMAPNRNICHNGGCGIRRIASSTEEANENSEKTITLSILCILAN